MSSRRAAQTATTKAQRIFLDLRTKILQKSILADTRLTLRPLAKQYQTGINAVSEAIKALSAEGLVELEGQAGARVVRRDLNRIHGEHVLRIAIECETARRCSKVADDLQMRILSQLAAKIDGLYEVGEQLTHCRELDVKFHLAVAEFCGILQLRDALEPLLERLVMLDQTSFPSWEYPCQKHSEVFAALESRDPETASEAMRQHCEHSMRLSLDVLCD